jgi:flagellar biosynthesis GTPase FlhF
MSSNSNNEKEKQLIDLYYSGNSNTYEYNYSEREKQVLGLYNQGKSTREIAKILRMSLRDISLILKKSQVNHGIAITATDNNKSSNEKSTQAYRLFEEGKKPVEVAIQLGLSEKEATRYYKEYWKLKRLYKLHQLYIEIEHCLPSFLKLHSALKRRGLNPGNVEWFANAIETGAVKLPELQNKYQSLQNKVQIMQGQTQKLERDSQIVQRRIIELTETEAMYSSNCETLLNEIEHRYNEKRQIEQFVSRFRNTNRKYLKIKSIAEEYVNKLLADQEPLLDLALNAVIEALRMAHDRYAIIYNTKYDNNVFASNNNNNGTVAAVSYSPNLYQNYYYNEYREGIIEIAKTFFNNTLDQIVDKIMVAAEKGE